MNSNSSFVKLRGTRINMEPLLSIGITSYKRLSELERCINSIHTSFPDEIEVIVSEDHSPLSKEICELVNRLADTSKYRIVFSPNEINLGYDMNLGAIIRKCSGKFIFFMSDDDYIEDGCIDRLIKILKVDDSHGVFYAPFVYEGTGKWDRYRGDDPISFKGSDAAAKYIYDSILFSGLIFRKDYVETFDSSRFKNINYFQVYLFLKMAYLKGGLYIPFPTVRCVGDGENAYGISESSGGNAVLADRKSVKSVLEFNKTLFKAIKMFDEEEGTNIFKSFEKQYSLHSYSSLSIARTEGKLYFKEYWSILNSLDIHLYPITKAYYLILLLFGKKTSDKLLSVFKKMVKKEKHI